MAITTKRTTAEANRRTDDETNATENTNTNATTTAELAISCAICGSILPLDTSRDWIDREAVECPTCRNVRGIEEVFS